MNQNSNSKITCDNLAVDIDTNLGSPSCKETDESNQCQPVFLMMKNVYTLEMIVEKFGSNTLPEPQHKLQLRQRDVETFSLT